MSDPEATANLESELAGTMFAGKLHYYKETASTNDLALEAAAAGAPEGTVFYADQQTAGRGRGSHSWSSDAGTSLLLSIVLRPAIAPLEALQLSLMAGIAAHAAVKSITSLNADLRWPNDLLMEGKKFCGILAEQSSEGSKLRHAVIGIGMNVNQAVFPPELAQLATSLRMVAGGRQWPREPLLAALLRALQSEYRLLLDEIAGAAPPRLFDRVAACSSYIRGKRVSVEEGGGYTGTTAGLDPRGFLLVETAAGRRTVVSGGVREI
jgi:BirA family biotin operon repressor/biotin-[acetyl-CoA-carboxylase] ligase